MNILFENMLRTVLEADSKIINHLYIADSKIYNKLIVKSIYDHEILNESYFDKRCLVYPIAETDIRWSVVIILNPILLFQQDSSNDECTVHVCNCQDGINVVSNIINFLSKIWGKLMFTEDQIARQPRIVRTGNDQINISDTGYFVLEYGEYTLF